MLVSLKKKKKKVFVLTKWRHFNRLFLWPMYKEWADFFFFFFQFINAKMYQESPHFLEKKEIKGKLLLFPFFFFVEFLPLGNPSVIRINDLQLGTGFYLHYLSHIFAMYLVSILLLGWQVGANLVCDDHKKWFHVNKTF